MVLTFHNDAHSFTWLSNNTSYEAKGLISYHDCVFWLFFFSTWNLVVKFVLNVWVVLYLIVLYSCCIVICWFMQKYAYIYCINTDTMINDASRKTHEERKQEERHRKTSFQIYLPLTLFVRFTCERMLETKHKPHIFTPLLWPSRCVFIVLLMLGSTPSGLSDGPLGLMWPSLPHLVSNPLGVCWQLHRGVSECPLGRVWLSLPHLVSSCLEVCWQLHRRFPRTPSVGCGFPYHISSLTLWESAGNCSGTQTQLS